MATLLVLWFIGQCLWAHGFFQHIVTTVLQVCFAEERDANIRRHCTIKGLPTTC
jgi:hypothetical protein